MPELALWQWAGIAFAVLAIVSPRVIDWVSQRYLSGDDANSTLDDDGCSCYRCVQAAGNLAEPSAHAKIDAFATLSKDLTPQLAEEVWAAIQPLRGGRTDATPVE